MNTPRLIVTGSKQRLARGQSYLLKARELSDLLAPLVDCSDYRLEFRDRATFRRSQHDAVVRERASGEQRFEEFEIVRQGSMTGPRSDIL